MTRITWSRERQQSLLGQLSGFWKGDIWDMRAIPLPTRLSAKTKQRRLRFVCKSATINGELKYACWKKFSDGDWRNTQELSRVHRMVKWLNSLDALPASLISRGLDEWRGLYTTYLRQRGMYHLGTTSRMDRENILELRRVTVTTSARFGNSIPSWRAHTMTGLSMKKMCGTCNGWRSPSVFRSPISP